MSGQIDHLPQSNELWRSILRAISQWLAGRFFGRTGAVGAHFDRRAVQPKAIDGNADHVMLLKRGKKAVQHACIRPTPHPGVDSVPISEARRQGTPFTAIFRDKQYRVDHPQVRNLCIATLNRHVRRNKRVLLFCYLIHNR